LFEWPPLFIHLIVIFKGIHEIAPAKLENKEGSWAWRKVTTGLRCAQKMWIKRHKIKIVDG